MLRRPSGMRPVKSAAHQPSSAADPDHRRVRPPEKESGDREETAEERHQPSLPYGWIDGQVDGIAAGSADEARERATDEKEERP